MAKRIFIGLLLLLLAASCYAQGGGTKTTKYTIKHDTKQMGQATSDKALVYIIRPSYLAPRTFTFTFANDQFIGVTDAKNYTYVLISPGQYMFWSIADQIDTVMLTVESGKTYHIQQQLAFGAYGPLEVKWAVYLRGVKEKKLKKYFKKSTYVTPTEQAHAKAQELIQKWYPKLQE